MLLKLAQMLALMLSSLLVRPDQHNLLWGKPLLPLYPDMEFGMDHQQALDLGLVVRMLPLPSLRGIDFDLGHELTFSL